ncbi:MAG: AraC family transcriptional regulator [Pseudomonadota bacterium]
MSKDQIKHLIEERAKTDGLSETGVKGVKIFRATSPVPCAPAVYEPSVIAIVSGAKEAVLQGQRFEYDSSHYMCCPTPMPVQAGTPTACAERPLLGVYISLDTRVMTELAIEMQRSARPMLGPKGGPLPRGFALARWDNAFGDALLRLLQLDGHSTDAAILGEGRLREFYYAVLTGEAGESARRAFGVGNEIARAIGYLTSELDSQVTIDDLASHVGMSRAVFHRKFKQATMMSPIQFAKSMRLNGAAMKIAGGMSVTQAAMDVGYASSSQFSREFKRLYGTSPKQWGTAVQVPAGAI